MSTSNELKTGSWTENEISQLLTCVEKYSGTVSLLVEEGVRITGRSKSSVQKKLAKMGVISRSHTGQYMSFNRRIGHQ